MALLQLLFAAIGAVLVLVGLAYLRGYWRIVQTSTSEVADVRPGMGLVELEGTARPIDEPRRAPLSGGETLLCEWKVQRYDTTGDDSNWVTIDSGEEFEPFLVDDGTGEILVDPGGAEWTLDRDFDHETDPETQPPRSIDEYLRDAEVDALYRTPEDERRTERRRYRERRLDRGEDVFVIGPVHDGPRDDTPDRAARAFVGTDRTEAEAAVEGRSTTLLTPGILPGVGDPEDTLSLGAAGESTIYAIADSGESAARRSMLKRGAIATLVGAFFFAVGVYFLFVPTSTPTVP